MTRTTRSKIKSEIQPVAKSSPAFSGEKAEEMNFCGAIKRILDGEKVTRYSWNNLKTSIFLENAILKIEIDGTVHNLIVSYEDMIGKDWVVI